MVACIAVGRNRMGEYVKPRCCVLALMAIGILWGRSYAVADDQSSAATLDSLSSERELLIARIEKLDEKIAVLRGQIASTEADTDSSTEVLVTRLSDDAFMMPGLTPGFSKARLHSGAEVKIRGLQGEYVVVEVGGSDGLMEREYFSRNEPAKAFIRTLTDARQKQFDVKAQEAAKAAAAEREKRLASEQRRERARRVSIIEKFGNELGARILAGDIWLGMTADMARASMGEPKSINRTVTASGTSEQWVYESSHKYLYFKDGILDGWQD